MKWIEPNIDSICTTGIIYYSDEYKETCKKICKILKIDILPDTNQHIYWNLIGENWIAQEINEAQKIPIDCKAYDEGIIEKMNNCKSNILFCVKNGLHVGILHFTNYNHQLIYQSLYQNFYSFETNLREYLISLGFRYDDFEKFYEYMYANSIKPTDIKYYENLLKKLRGDNFRKEAEKLKPLQRLDFKELLLFTLLKDNIFGDIKDIEFAKKILGKISDLRNTVMHSKDFTGATESLPFVFKTYEKFFKQVIEFRNAFLRLSEIRIKHANYKKISYNNNILKQIDGMEEKEIEDFFYNRLK